MISPASILDIPDIQSIAHESWPVAYTGIISSEQIDFMLELMYSTSSLQRQMQELSHRFFIARNEGMSIGFAAVGDEGSGVFKLHKLYVRPSVKGTGVGKKLLMTAEDYARQMGARELILQVNRKNPSVQFYQRQGLQVQRETVLELGHGFVMDDFIMGKSL